VQCAAERFDVLGVAGLLETRLSRTPRSWGALLESFPELQRRVSPGVKDLGSMSFAVLHRDPFTQGLVVLAAMSDCMAPAHLHVGRSGQLGEVTVTLAGTLEEPLAESTESIGPIGRGLSTCALWRPGTIHQPRADLWLGVYSQPGGSVLVSTLPKGELLEAYRVAVGDSEFLPPGWTEMSDEAARSWVAENLGFVL